MSLRIKILNALCACFLLNLVLSLPAKAQLADSRQWSKTVNGIQMSISDAGYVKAGVPNLRVAFRNLSDADTYLYLGTVGGSGPRPCELNDRHVTCTLNLSLNITDARGTTRQFKFKGMMLIAGHLFIYVVYLQAHSTYSLDIGMDQFWSPATQQYELKLAPGKYRVSLQFEGREPEKFSSFLDQQLHILDSRYIKQTEFWKGQLQSNTLELKIEATSNGTTD